MVWGLRLSLCEHPGLFRLDKVLKRKVLEFWLGPSMWRGTNLMGGWERGVTRVYTGNNKVPLGQCPYFSHKTLQLGYYSTQITSYEFKNWAIKRYPLAYSSRKGGRGRRWEQNLEQWQHHVCYYDMYAINHSASMEKQYSTLTKLHIIPCYGKWL